MRTSLLALLLLPVMAQAVPHQFSHQGRLFDSLGAPLDGPHTLQFSLYDAPSGGALIWQEEQTDIPFELGYFQVHLGDITPLDSDHFADAPLYLELNVDGMPPLPTRLPLTAVPFAITAENLRGGVVDAAVLRVGGREVVSADGQFTGDVNYQDVLGTPEWTLSSLNCSPGDIARFDGTWGCAPQLPAHVHDASDLTTGTLDRGRLPVGTSNGTVAAGDHTHVELSDQAAAIAANAAAVASHTSLIDEANTAIAGNSAALAVNSAAIAANTSAVATNTAAIAANTSAVATNTSAVAANTGDIAANTTAIATNTTANAANTTAVATNTSAIAANTGDIAANTTAIAANTSDIAANTTAIAANTTAVATNATAIAANTTAVATNSSAISTNSSAISANTTAIGTNSANISANALSAAAAAQAADAANTTATANASRLDTLDAALSASGQDVTLAGGLVVGAVPGTSCTVDGMLRLEGGALEVCSNTVWVSLALARAGGSATTAVASCASLTAFGITTSGAYWLDPDGGSSSNAYQAYCDMTLASGGWTLALNLDTSDGHVMWWAHKLWTDNNTYGDPLAPFNSDHKSAAYLNLTGWTEIMLVVHQQGTVVGWKSFARSGNGALVDYLNRGDNTLLGGSVTGSSTGAIWAGERLVRTSTSLYANHCVATGGGCTTGNTGSPDGDRIGSNQGTPADNNGGGLGNWHDMNYCCSSAGGSYGSGKICNGGAFRTTSEAQAGWAYTTQNGTFGTDTFGTATATQNDTTCGNANWAKLNNVAYDYAIYLR